VQADVLQVAAAASRCCEARANNLQLCGRRTFYQLLVCDNAAETDIGAPYYSNQQLFPGFMMTEYDGRALNYIFHPHHPLSSFRCPSPLPLLLAAVSHPAPGRCWMTCSDFCNDKLRDW
jgi:hypothetical protein